MRPLGAFLVKGSEAPRRFIEFEGKTQSLVDWAKSLNITPKGLSKRLEKWDLEKALTLPVNVVCSSRLRDKNECSRTS